MRCVAGVWQNNRFVTADLTGWALAQIEIFRLISSIQYTLAAAGGDWDTVLDQLGLSESLLDSAEFVAATELFSTAAPHSLTPDQYSAYVWMCAVLRECLPAGDVIWQNRAVLLDNSEPADWLVLHTLK
jgi:hypothetical protein